MVPHDPVQRTGQTIHDGDLRPSPAHRIEDPPESESIHLRLIAVRQRVAKSDEASEATLVSRSVAAGAPPAVSCCDLRPDVEDADSLEVPLDARQVGIASIDPASFDRHPCEQWSEPGIGFGEHDGLLRGEVVQIAGEPLELGDDAKHVGVRNGATDLERAAPSATVLTKPGVCLGEQGDGCSSLTVPVAQR